MLWEPNGSRRGEFAMQSLAIYKRLAAGRPSKRFGRAYVDN
jgi:hypothetical protein